MQPPVYSKVTPCGNFLRHQLEVYIRRPLSQDKPEGRRGASEEDAQDNKHISTGAKNDIERTPTPEERRRTSEEDVTRKDADVLYKACVRLIQSRVWCTTSLQPRAKCAPDTESVNIGARS